MIVQMVKNFTWLLGINKNKKKTLWKSGKDCTSRRWLLLRSVSMKMVNECTHTESQPISSAVSNREITPVQTYHFIRTRYTPGVATNLLKGLLTFISVWWMYCCLKLWGKMSWLFDGSAKIFPPLNKPVLTHEGWTTLGILYCGVLCYRWPLWEYTGLGLAL